jgi:hypothetical protein
MSGRAAGSRELVRVELAFGLGFVGVGTGADVFAADGLIVPVT